MRHHLGARRAPVLVVAGALAAALAVVVPSFASPSGNGPVTNDRKLQKDAEAAEQRDEMSRAANEYEAMRIAPGTSLDPAAFTTARAAAASLPTVGGAWSEVTTKRYDSDDPSYRDPVWSNSGGGAGLVSGRMTAVAVDPRNARTAYAGAADGGVWKSTDRGAHWTPVFDSQPTQAVGAIAVNPADGSVWVGTGENNTAFENYTGQGVFRSTDGGGSWTNVAPDLAGRTIGAIVFDGAGGVYAATNFGLYKGSAAGTGFTKVLDAATVGQAPAPYGMSIVNSVAVQPGTGGQVVVANMAWRGGAGYDGFYVSRDGGRHFAYDSLTGAINPKALGRASLAYSADGSKLYAVVEDTFLFNKPNVQTANTVLMGVFVSAKGDPSGPWNQIADYRKLANSGSALKLSKGYGPGVQAWYNQFVAVDPADANHVYLGLEEVFETRNGGSSWNAIGPYWNFPLDCWTPARPEACPPTTHPDQHGVAVGGGYLFVGNDGGMYSRSTSADPTKVSGWNDLNATLRTLQYYYAGIGRTPSGDAVWGGLQDNGESLLRPDLPTMVSPFGGDGGDTLVDPDNGDRAVVEYVDLDMALTTNGGYSPNYSIASFTEITPSCFPFTYAPRPDCDPNPRFIAPFRADAQSIDHWVAGGEFVWDNGGAGWDTRRDTWKRVYDTGAGDSVTAIGVNGNVTYAGWCGPVGCNPRTSAATGSSEGFVRGIATNYGGTWHELDMSGLPNRYVNNLIVDKADAAHVYAIFGGFSRRWIPNAGVGHVFESTNGGATWTDISGNLPDAPTDDLLITASGKLVLGTDVGVFVASQTAPTAWSRLGTGLPNAAVNDLTPGPTGGYVVAATHGRGLWRITTP